MAIPPDLPQKFKDCLSNKVCGKCSFLKCEAFLDGRRIHLEARMVQACNDMVNWRQFEIAAIERKRQQIKEIPEAIKRLHSGGFGRCRDCGDAIAKERLEDIPETQHCAPCHLRLNAAFMM